jgi:hypothetical protein
VSLYQVPGINTPYGEQLVNAGDPPSLIINRDLTKQLLISTDSSLAGLSQTSGNLSIIDPLGAMAVDGTESLYANNVGTGFITVDVQVGGTYWAPSPAQVAEQISALGLATLAEQINQNTAIPGNISTTGAPLLNLYNLVADQASTGLPSGNAITIGPETIGQIAYEFVIQIGATQNTAITPCSIEFQWTDSTSGLVTATQVYNVYGAYTGAGGNPHIIEGHGPSNSDTLTVTITNSGAQALQIAYSLLQSSRLYQRHEWRTQNPAGNISFPTFTYISCAPAINILAAQQTGSIANNTSVTYLLPFYVGTALVYLHSATAAVGASATLQDNLTNLNSVSIQKYSSIATGDLAPPGSATLPRDQCTIVVANATGAASNVQFGMIAQELQTA